MATGFKSHSRGQRRSSRESPDGPVRQSRRVPKIGVLAPEHITGAETGAAR